MGLGTLLVRADASPEIGTGHVMRCLALAQAWQDAGGEVVYAMSSTTPSAQQRLLSEGCSLVAVPAHPGTAEDAAFTCELAHRVVARCVVVDSYEFGSEYQRHLQRDSWMLVCLDDEGRCEYYSADIVLNQNVTANANWYRNCRPGTQLLLGTSFCLLRREFNSWQQFKRKVKDHVHKILITLGGSPPAGLVSGVVESILAINLGDVGEVVVLGASTGSHEISEWRAKFAGKLAIQKDISDMATLMTEADMAISAAGSTCWELSLLGVPTVLLDVASNQTSVALELEKRRCALYAGDGNKLDHSKLARTVEALLQSFELRKDISSRSRQLVDGLGSQRVLSALRGARPGVSFALQVANQ